MRKVSIICYINEVEIFISRCIDSLVRQTYPEIEIICVNSNTLDNSITIIKEYAAKDPRLCIIHLDAHRGSGAARNEGLARATGDYVQFVDATDWIDLDLTRALVARIEAEEADFALCGYSAEGRTDGPASPFLTLGAERLACDLKIDLIRNRNVLFEIDPSAVLALHRRDQLTAWGARFSERPFFDDVSFYLATGLRSKSIAIVDGPRYHRGVEASHSPDRRTSDGTIDMLRGCFEEIDRALAGTSATRAKVAITTRAVADCISRVSNDCDALEDLITGTTALLKPFSPEDIYLDADPRLDRTTLRSIAGISRDHIRQPTSDKLIRNGQLTPFQMHLGPSEATGFAAGASIKSVRFEPGWTDIQIDFDAPQDLSQGRLRSLVLLETTERAALRFAFICGPEGGGDIIVDAYFTFYPGLNLLAFGGETFEGANRAAALGTVRRIYFGGDADGMVTMSLALIDGDRSTDLISLSDSSRLSAAKAARADAEPPVKSLHLCLADFEAISPVDLGRPSSPIVPGRTLVEIVLDPPISLNGKTIRALFDLQAEDIATIRFVFTPVETVEAGGDIGAISSVPTEAFLERELSSGTNLLTFGLRELGSATLTSNPPFRAVRIDAVAGSGCLAAALTLIEPTGERPLTPTERAHAVNPLGAERLADASEASESILASSTSEDLVPADQRDLATILQVSRHAVPAGFDLRDAGSAVARLKLDDGWTDVKLTFPEPLDLSTGEFRGFVHLTATEPLVLRFALVCLPDDPHADPDAWHLLNYLQRLEPGLTLVNFRAEGLTDIEGVPRISAVRAVYFGGFGTNVTADFSLTFVGSHTSVDLVASSVSDGSGTGSAETLGAGGSHPAPATSTPIARTIASPEPLSAALSTLVDDVGGALAGLATLSMHLAEVADVSPEIGVIANAIAAEIEQTGNAFRSNVDRVESFVPRNDASHAWAPTWAPSRFPTFFHGNSWSWSDGFKAFHFVHRDQIDQMLAELVEGLDAESKAVALAFWETAVFKIPFARASSATGALLRRDYIFTARDLIEQQRILAQYDHDVAGIELAGDRPREVPVFCYHHGLRNIQTRYLNYIAGHDALDCGGYVGDSAYVLAKNYAFRRVVAIEADADNHAAIVALAERYRLHTVEALHCGVGREAGELTFFGSDSVTSSHAGSDASNAQIVPIRTIDSIVESLGLSPRFIKMDIEGMETDALLGARKTLERHRPILAISIYHRAEDFLGIKPFLERLGLGYTFEIQHQNPFDPLYETMLIARPEISDE